MWYLLLNCGISSRLELLFLAKIPHKNVRLNKLIPYLVRIFHDI